ncbi:hypothetical protein J6W91_01895 [Candidatus Saccharibacteria bacterium]|nr:hypothetical protein [Candidatus Saccharibacteria bacterium]
MAEEAAKPNKKLIGIIAGIVAAVAVVATIIIVALNSTPKVVGKYTISAFIEDGEENTSMIDLIKAFGAEYTVEFKKDKTGILKMGMGDEKQELEFKYDDKEIKATKDGQEEKMTYEYKDDTVILSSSSDSTKMKFKREGK